MIVTLIGARPQFVKAAVVSKELLSLGITETIVHSGQHYDVKMSDVFWEELGIPGVAHNLECGSGAQGKQTASIIEGFEKYLLQLPALPKATLLYGDTNSTLAGAIVAAKLQIPIIHVEAGLRSFNRAMPEEINRIVTDHLSELLFCPSIQSVEQLRTEGINKNVHEVGDVMYDAFLTFRHAAKNTVSEKFGLRKNDFAILTVHRPSNTDSPKALEAIFKALAHWPGKILWPVHPRLKSSLNQVKMPDHVVACEPLSYLEMLDALLNCAKVITDSGGLQKEAYWSKKPCITLRSETEWVETLHNDWNILTGADEARIFEALTKEIDPDTWVPLYGQGSAAATIAHHIKSHLSL